MRGGTRQIAPSPQWSHFPHGADVGVRGSGATLAEALAGAALAMTAASVDPDAIRADTPVEIKCSGHDEEDLLYCWLNALVYEMAIRGMVFARFDIEITGTELVATAWGEEVSQKRHQPAVEIKGATWTELAVRRENGRWLAQCVVDV